MRKLSPSIEAPATDVPAAVPAEDDAAAATLVNLLKELPSIPGTQAKPVEPAEASINPPTATLLPELSLVITNARGAYDDSMFYRYYIGKVQVAAAHRNSPDLPLDLSINGVHGSKAHDNLLDATLSVIAALQATAGA